MYRTGLLDLPEDLVIEQILGRLDFRDCIRCSMACKALRCMLEASSALQLKVELGADGILDTTLPVDCSITSAEKLQNHLERRRGWRSLDWKRVERIGPTNPCAMYEYRDGVYAQIENHLYPGTDQWFSSSTIIQTPSAGRAEREIVFEDMGIWAAALTFDPMQDVLALIERHGTDSEGRDALVISDDNKLLVHLRSLTTDRAHTLASKPILDCFYTPSDRENVAVKKFEIFDDMLAVILGPGPAYACMWNWKTGQVVFDLCIPRAFLNPESISSLCSDFCFVSSRVIASVAFDTEKEPGEQAWFDVFLISDPISAPMEEISGSSSSRNLTHACSLYFPPMVKELWDVDISASSSSLQTPIGLLFATIQYRTHHSHDSDDDSASDGDEYMYGCHIITSSTSVLGYAARHTQDFRALSWQEWGPESSKVFAENLDVEDKIHNANIRSAMGKRLFFTYIYSLETKGVGHSAVIEFGYHLLREEHFPRSEDSRHDGTDTRAPTIVRERSQTDILLAGKNSPFAIDVECRLPWRSVSMLAHPPGYNARYPQYKLDVDRMVAIEGEENQTTGIELFEYIF